MNTTNLNETEIKKVQDQTFISKLPNNSVEVTLAGTELGWSLDVGIAIAVIVIVFGSISNILTIWAYKRSRKLQNTFNLLIANLCAVQLLFSSVILVFILPGIVKHSQPYNFTICGIVGFSYYSVFATVLINLVTIAVNRYVGVLYPHKYKQWFSPFRVKVCLACIWLISPILHLPLVIGKMISWSSAVLRCTINITDGEINLRYYNLAINLMFQGIPFILMIYIYTMIIRKVRSLRLNLKSHTIKKKSFTSGNSSQGTSFSRGKRCETGEGKAFLKKNKGGKIKPATRTDETSIQIHETSMGKSNQQGENFKPDNRIVKDLTSGDDLNSNISFSSTDNKLDYKRGKNITRNNIPKSNKKTRSSKSKNKLERQLAYSSFFICLSFALCMLPTSLLFVVQVLTNKQMPPAVNFIVGAITWLHAVINPIIYGYWNKQYQKEYKKIFKLLPCFR